MDAGATTSNVSRVSGGSFSGGADAGTAARITGGSAGDVWVDTGSGNFQIITGGGGGGSFELTAVERYRHDYNQVARQDSFAALANTVEQLRSELLSTTAALEYMAQRVIELESHCFPRNNE